MLYVFSSCVRGCALNTGIFTVVLAADVAGATGDWSEQAFARLDSTRDRAGAGDVQCPQEHVGAGGFGVAEEGDGARW